MSDAAGRGQSAGQRDLIRLHRQYDGWLVRRLRLRFGSQDCEDLVQETWARLASVLALGTVRHPKAFLLRVATNLALNWRKHDAVVSRDIGRSASAHRVEADQDHSLMLSELILGLPEPLRDVFLLSRFGGLSNAEIGEKLGISTKTVEWRMTKALSHCAAQLRR